MTCEDCTADQECTECQELARPIWDENDHSTQIHKTLVWASTWIDGTRVENIHDALLTINIAVSSWIDEEATCTPFYQNAQPKQGWKDDAYWHLIEINSIHNHYHLHVNIRYDPIITLNRATVIICPFPDLTILPITQRTIDKYPWASCPFGMDAIGIMTGGRPFTWRNGTAINVIRALLLNEENAKLNTNIT